MEKGLYPLKEEDLLLDTETNDLYRVVQVDSFANANTGSVEARRVEIDKEDKTSGTSINETWDAPQVGWPGEGRRYVFHDEKGGSAEKI